jgi:hypothetical protein
MDHLYNPVGLLLRRPHHEQFVLPNNRERHAESVLLLLFPLSPRTQPDPTQRERNKTHTLNHLLVLALQPLDHVLSSGDDRPSARENTLLLGELVARSLRDNVETEAEEVEEHSTVGDDVGEVNDLWVRMGQDREEHRVSSEKGKGESESRGEIVMRK